jgi:hypothetical protein
MASLGGLRARLATVVAVACFVLPVADAQAPLAGLVGLVRDSTGHAIPGVEVRISGGQLLYARTDDSGGFRLTGLAPGATRVTVRRLGFAPDTVHLTLRAGRIDSLVLSLGMVAAALPGVLVQDEYEARSHRILAGFWERRSRGFGSFLTRDEIERRNPYDFVDLARGIPSMRILSINGRPTIRFGRSMTLRDCPPQYIVDGMRIENGSPDEFAPQDIEALEIYPGPATTPPQFTNRPFTYTCGAIVIWTRIPG